MKRSLKRLKDGQFAGVCLLLNALLCAPAVSAQGPGDAGKSDVMPPLAPSLHSRKDGPKPAPDIVRRPPGQRPYFSATSPSAPTFSGQQQYPSTNAPVLTGSATTYGASSTVGNAVFTNPLQATAQQNTNQPNSQANNQALKGAARIGVNEVFNVAGRANLGGTGVLLQSLHCPLCRLLSQ
jgi:hypothetical protein